MFDSEKSLNGSFRLLYQGSIGPNHGLEEIIPLLGECIGGFHLDLVLKGFISEEYANELKDLSTKNGVQDRVIFLPPSGYGEVVRNAQTCHIGIGIHKKDDMMNRTLGKASNKIYEYAAAGAPVLIFDNSHFRHTLRNRDWVFFTDTSKESLRASILEIVSDYARLSACAEKDFRSELCFENKFDAVVNALNKWKYN